MFEILRRSSYLRAYTVYKELFKNIALNIGLTYERNGKRGSRNGVGDHQQEHGERQQNGDAQRDFLSSVWRQKESDEDERGQHETRQDDVHQIELVAASQRQREDDMCVAVARTTGQHRHVPIGPRTVHLPLAILLEIVRWHLLRPHPRRKHCSTSISSSAISITSTVWSISLLTCGIERLFCVAMLNFTCLAIQLLAASNV